MKVIVSKTIGYCLGVDKTIVKANEVLKLAKQQNLPAYSIGELIHNKDIVERFEQKGLKLIHGSDVQPGIALIRAHGIPVKLEEEFEQKGFTLIDSTCPFIIKTKELLVKAEACGRTIVVIGEKDHAEVKTIISSSPSGKYLISTHEECENLIKNLAPNTMLSVAVQSTFSEYEYGRIRKCLKDSFPDIQFINELCKTCSDRKQNALRMAEQCEAFLVVGGKTSANTTELANYIKRTGKPVFKIENTADFSDTFDLELKKFNTMGLCSGTSTPNDIVESVRKHLENL